MTHSQWSQLSYVTKPDGIKAKMMILFHRLSTFVKQWVLTEFKVSYIVYETDSTTVGRQMSHCEQLCSAQQKLTGLWYGTV